MCCFQEQLPLIRNEHEVGSRLPSGDGNGERERTGLFGSGFVFPLWCPGSGIVTMFWRLYQSSPRLLSNMVGLRRTLKIGASELNYQSVARWNFETASAQSQTYTGNHLKLPEENCLQWLEGKLDVRNDVYHLLLKVGKMLHQPAIVHVLSFCWCGRGTEGKYRGCTATYWNVWHFAWVSMVLDSWVGSGLNPPGWRNCVEPFSMERLLLDFFCAAPGLASKRSEVDMTWLTWTHVFWCQTL